MAEEAPKPPHKEFQEFMHSVRKHLVEQKQTASESKEADEHFYKRQIRDISARAKSVNTITSKLAKHSEYLKNTSEQSQANYASGLMAIENIKMFGRDIKNVVKNTGDALSKQGFLESILKKNGEVVSAKLESVKETMKSNRERMVHAIQTAPAKMAGAIVNGVTAGVDKLREGLANKHDKLLAYFGNKDARDRIEKKMAGRQGGSEPGSFKTDVKENAKKAGGWLKKMLGVLTTFGTGAFKGIFTKLFPAIGKFLLKNIGKLGLVGLAVGLLTTFWDDISNFVSKLFSGDSSEGSSVTKDGVKGMLDKLWGFVNDMIKDLFGVDLGKVLADKGIDIGSITTTISEYITPVINGFMTVASALGNTFKSLIKSAFGEEGKPGKMTEVFDNIKAIASGLIDGAKNLLGGLFNFEGKDMTFGEVVKAMMGKFESFVNMIMDGARRLTEYILDPSALVADVKNAFGGLGRMVSNVFSDIMISLKALVQSKLNPLESYDEALGRLKKEDAKEKQKEADMAEASLKSGLKAMGLDSSVLTKIQTGMDVGTFIRENFGDKDLNETQKGVIENQIRTIVDARERAQEQQFEAMEAAAEGTVQKMLEEHKKTNLGAMLTGDATFKKQIQELAGMQSGKGYGLHDDTLKKSTTDFISKMDKGTAQKFLAQLETLDKAGDFGEKEAEALAKQLGLGQIGGEKGNALEFFEMLMDAENIKKAGTKMTFSDIHGDKIGEDVADALLATGFKQNNEAIAEAVKQIAGTTANLSMLPAILAQLPGAVAAGSAQGGKQNPAKQGSDMKLNKSE